MILLSSRPHYHRRRCYCSSLRRSPFAVGEFALLRCANGDADPLRVVPRSYTCQADHPIATADAHDFRRLLRDPPQSKLHQVVQQEIQQHQKLNATHRHGPDADDVFRGTYPLIYTLAKILFRYGESWYCSVVFIVNLKLLCDNAY